MLVDSTAKLGSVQHFPKAAKDILPDTGRILERIKGLRAHILSLHFFSKVII
jgi:hypothetical protein